MNKFDPEWWSLPVFVFIGMIISQLFLYGKKIKHRVHITASEIFGDVLQFGVRMVITVATIRTANSFFHMNITDLWQVVGITVLICTSFDVYFMRLRDIAMERALGAVSVLLGRMPENALTEVPKGKGLPSAVKMEIVADNSSVPPRTLKVGSPLVRTYQPATDTPKEMQELLDRMKTVPPGPVQMDLSDDQE